MKELRKPALEDLIYSILSYQYNDVFASIFLEDFKQMNIKYSRKTGKIREILLNNKIQAVYRPMFGTFTISIDCANRIYPILQQWAKKNGKEMPFTVQIQSEVNSFVMEGKSVFAKHVLCCSKDLHVGDFVFVIDEEDNLLAIGKLKIPPHYVGKLHIGGFVATKKGINALALK